MDTLKDTTIEIEGLDLIDVLEFISAKRNKFIAIMLSDLELILPKGTNEYKYIRKLVLDGMNDYTRSLVRVLLGDVEGLNLK